MSILRHCAAAVALVVASAAGLAPAHAQTLQKQDAVFPPWQHGANNDAQARGLEFTVPDADNLADFHGNPANAKLVLYVGGNYFFAMAPLVKAFEAAHPSLRGRLYWETIPPGLLVKQMEAGGTVTVGNMTWTAKPDAYFAGLKAVERLIGEGKLAAPAVPYMTNNLAIMVPKGNPAGIAGLADLGRPDVHLAMPDPAFEGVARQIKAALVKTGGDALVESVYGSKVRDGSTVLTHIHHRQTPLFLMQGRAQAGVTWKSEALFQEQAGHPIEHIDIPTAANASAVYAGAVVNGAAHGDAARQWLAFLTTSDAQSILKHYGFKPYQHSDEKLGR